LSDAHSRRTCGDPALSTLSPLALADVARAFQGFAWGDVRFSPVKRVASAVGEGSIAIAFIYEYLAERVRIGRRAFRGAGRR